jgi:hypothetical protein
MTVIRLVFDRSQDDGEPPARQRIGHHLVFANENSIGTAVGQLRSQRFEVEVWRKDSLCTIVAAQLIAPASVVMEQVTEFFEDFARDHSGEYRGWVVMTGDRK